MVNLQSQNCTPPQTHYNISYMLHNNYRYTKHMILQTHTQFHKCTYYKIFAVSEYCEQHTGQSQYWEQHTCQSQYCEQHTCQSQYINQQRLSQCLNYLNKRDTKGTYNVSTLAFNMIITRQLSPATSCRFLHHIDMAHLATTHTHGKVPTGSNKHLSDKTGTL